MPPSDSPPPDRPPRTRRLVRVPVAVHLLLLTYITTNINKALHPCAFQKPSMDVETDPAERFKYVLSGSVIAFPSAALTLALLTSPVLYWSLRRGPAVGGVAVLALTGWSLYLGQRIVLEGPPDVPEEYGDLDWRWRAGLTVLGIVYYNVVLLVTVYASVRLTAVGFGLAGAVVAFVFPAYDVAVTERGVPLSISGLLALVTRAVLVASNVSESVAPAAARVDELVVELVGGSRRRFG